MDERVVGLFSFVEAHVKDYLKEIGKELKDWELYSVCSLLMRNNACSVNNTLISEGSIYLEIDREIVAEFCSMYLDKGTVPEEECKEIMGAFNRIANKIWKIRKRFDHEKTLKDEEEGLDLILRDYQLILERSRIDLDLMNLEIKSK